MASTMNPAAELAAKDFLRLEDAVAVARDALQAKNPEKAQSACQDILACRGDVPAAWYLHGKAARERGDNATAVASLRQAVALRPALTEYRLALADALAANEQAEDALENCRTACFLTPGSSSAWLKRGQLEKALGLLDASLVSTQTGTKLALGQSKTVLRYKIDFLAACLGRLVRRGRCDTGLARAEAALKNGLFGIAANHLQAVLRRNPANREAALELARLYITDKAYPDALAVCDEAERHGNIDPALSLRRAQALAHMARLEEAVPMARSAIRSLQDDPDALCILATILRLDVQHEARKECLDQALAIDPNHRSAVGGTALYYVDAGKKDEAAEWALRALAIDPSAGSMWINLARAGAMTLGDETATRLADLMNGGPAEYGAIPQEERARLHFTCFFLHDRAGDYDAAFEHLEKANALIDVTFSREGHEIRLHRLMDTFDARYFSTLAPRPDPAASTPIQPIFVVGMPRSGTSLTEQILSAHPEVHGAGELNFFNGIEARLIGGDIDVSRVPERFSRLSEHELGEFRAEYLALLESRAPDGCRFAVDKMPTNFLHLGMIATLFPDAPVLNCTRDPMDTCFSIYGLHFTGTHSYAYDLGNLGAFYRGYARLMDHWRKVLPNPFVEVSYEALVGDQAGQTRRILDEIGLQWDSTVLNFHEVDRVVGTASSFQANQPIHKASVGKWNRYADRLAPLKSALAGTAA